MIACPPHPFSMSGSPARATKTWRRAGPSANADRAPRGRPRQSCISAWAVVSQLGAHISDARGSCKGVSKGLHDRRSDRIALSSRKNDIEQLGVPDRRRIGAVELERAERMSEHDKAMDPAEGCIR